MTPRKFLYCSSSNSAKIQCVTLLLVEAFLDVSLGKKIVVSILKWMNMVENLVSL